MTWNINRFDGADWSWYEKKKDKSMDERERIADKIINVLNSFLYNSKCRE